MEKIKVAFFAEVLIKEFDGATRTMFQIIDRIDQSKFEFLFFCGVQPSTSFEHEVYHVPSLTIPFNKTYKMASMVGMGPGITAKLNSFKPDVIHIATPSLLGYYGLKYGRAQNIPVLSIYHTHFISYIKYYTKNTPLITQALEQAVVAHNKSFYDKCNLLYMPTNEMIKQLSNRGFKTDHMKLWRRGIDLELFTPVKKDKEYIKNLVRNDFTNLLFTSRLVWEKNLETLIGIYNLARERGLKYNFIIAGDGVARKELERRMPFAFFLKHTKHEVLSRIYASSDYFIFPSVTETYGNVVAEAMASGLPCIVADGGGVKSFVKQGVNGFLCKPNDPEDYLRMIEILSHQPELRKNITERAYKDIMNLEWDVLAARYFDDIIELANTPIQNDRPSQMGLIAI